MDNPHVVRFLEDKMSEYAKDGIPDNNPLIYSLVGDSIFMRGTFRPDKSKAKIFIKNDTLYLELNTSREFRRFVNSLEWDYNMETPKDIKLEKMVRYVTFVRVHDCDQYQE